MSKFLALCDLDDTLLTGEKIIKEESIDYLKKFTEAGNYFCIATGRPYSGCYNFYNDLSLNMPLVTDNGCAIYNLNGKDVFFEIPYNVWMSFLNEAKGLDRMMYATTSHNISYCHNRPRVPEWILHDEIDGMQIIEGEFTEISKYPPLICNFWVKEECVSEFMEIIKKYDEYFDYMDWGHREDFQSIEIRSINASKGKALKYLKNALNIDDDKTLAFGDQLNDLSMIDEAHYGVAMINAVDALKEKANYQTDLDFNNNGVIDFLNKNIYKAL